MRAFVGLPVPEAWIGPLCRAQSRILGGRKVDAEDLHLTLAFLDDQPEDRLEALHELLEARPASAVALRPLAYAVFGAGRARLMALDVAATPELTGLRDAVRTACRRAGIDLPRERFRPHVTLVRFPASAPGDPARLSGAVAALGVPVVPPELAGAASLWSSTLTPEGPIYEPLATYPLVAA
ncbi:RNA 2',3'-cyclic phosphodiesterase [uncultured Jannaschia sp.]|uniref:RNA 2',3'-cyclic phosphodiesterase n=1 Tax=uncultured Jannaschia sp. TaxID=293347 RepID=UPI0026184CDD|nr:RNA 2',3'-cyclic phosphodiesterase [uncultured Jannaschia sp.]